MNADGLFNYLLGLADDGLVLGHRLSEWSGRAPMLEEDIALSNLALDLIGQARLLYSYAGEVEGEGRDEDKLAYFRDAYEFRNLLLVEQPNGDFAATMMRHFLYAAFAQPHFSALAASTEPTLAGIAAKAATELTYHLRHASEWVIRLGDGTPESHRRIEEALEELWPYTGEMFAIDDPARELVTRKIAIDPADLRPAWETTVRSVLGKATLDWPGARYMQLGGRTGRHSELLGKMLAEMQVLARAHPGASW